MDYSLPDSSVHGDSPGKDTRVGFHALLQGSQHLLSVERLLYARFCSDCLIPINLQKYVVLLLLFTDKEVEFFPQLSTLKKKKKKEDIQSRKR